MRRVMPAGGGCVGKGGADAQDVGSPEVYRTAAGVVSVADARQKGERAMYINLSIQ